MTPSGIEPATFRFVAQNLNHCATAVPATYKSRANFMVWKWRYEPRLSIYFWVLPRDRHFHSAVQPSHFFILQAAVTPRWLWLNQAYYHSGNTSDSHAEDSWFESRIELFWQHAFPSRRKRELIRPLNFFRTSFCIYYLFIILATGWTVRGSKPYGDENFPTYPDRPWGLPASYRIDTASLSLG
jgi:hypothetical protein